MVSTPTLLHLLLGALGHLLPIPHLESLDKPQQLPLRTLPPSVTPVSTSARSLPWVPLSGKHEEPRPGHNHDQTSAKETVRWTLGLPTVRPREFERGWWWFEGSHAARGSSIFLCPQRRSCFRLKRSVTCQSSSVKRPQAEEALTADVEPSVTAAVCIIIARSHRKL